MRHENELATENTFKLIAKFSIPAVVGMVVNSIYNMVDRIFIGNFVGEDALAGLVVAFPVMMFYFAFTGLIGVGTSALVSIKFGEKENDYANRVYGNALTLMTIATIIGVLFGLLFLDPILELVGAKGNVLIEAEKYLRIILAGICFQMFSFLFSSLARSESKPKLAMVSLITSAVSNIILDYVFIVNFDMGSAGAALATIMAQAIGFFIVFRYFVSKKSILQIKKENLKLDKTVVSEIFTIGSSDFVNTVGVSLSAGLLNTALYKYGGNSAMTAMGAINSLYTLFIMPVMGIQQGLQPIFGYNHGADLHKRVKQVLYRGIIVASTFSIIVFVVLMIFPDIAISLFIDKNSETMPIAIEGLRYYILMLPVLSINLITVSFYRSTGRGKLALYLGSTRQFVFLIPLLFILPSLFDLTGVWLVAPVADFLSIAVSVFFLYITLKEYV